MLRDNLLLAFACFAEQPMTKAHNRAATIRQSVGKSRKHDRLSELPRAVPRVRPGGAAFAWKLKDNRWSKVEYGEAVDEQCVLLVDAAAKDRQTRTTGISIWVFIVMLGQTVD